MSWLLPPLEPNFDAALRDVGAKRSDLRVAAAKRLGSPPPAQAAAANAGLVRLSQDPHPAVRREALTQLARLGDPAGLGAALDRIEDPNPDVRELAVIAMAEIGGERADETLRSCLYAEHAEVRFQAVLAYAERCPDEATLRLPQLLEDADPKVRAQVLSALRQLPAASDHQPALRRSLEDRDVEVRTQAALALGAVGDVSGVALLYTAVTHPEHGLEAMETLVKLRPEGAANVLFAATQRLLVPAFLRAAAAAALVQIDDGRGVPILRKMLRSWRSPVRHAALIAARHLETPELAADVARVEKRDRRTFHDTHTDDPAS